MAKLGAFCFPGTGHINPMTALARRLQQRGHQVVLFGIADTEARVRAAGIDFHLIGQQDYPLGTLQKLDQRLGELKGLATFRFTVDRVKNTARMILRDGPQAVREEKVDALLVDEADMGGNVAEHLGLPYVSIAFFPPLVQDDRIPPFCFGWPAGQDPLSRLRNQPGVAARVAARGAGIVIPRSKLTAARLRRALQSVLENDSYRAAARHLALSISQVDGLEIAVNVIESTLRLTTAPSQEAAQSGLVRAGNMRLGNQFGQSDPGENQESATGWAQAHPLAHEEE